MAQAALDRACWFQSFQPAGPIEGGLRHHQRAFCILDTPAHFGSPNGELKPMAGAWFCETKTLSAPVPNPNSSPPCSRIFVGLAFNGRKDPIVEDPTALTRK